MFYFFSVNMCHVKTIFLQSKCTNDQFGLKFSTYTKFIIKSVNGAVGGHFIIGMRGAVLIKMNLLHEKENKREEIHWVWW